MAGTHSSRRRSVVSAETILAVLAKQGVSKDQVNLGNFEQALREYRTKHPDSVFERELRATLAYSDFAHRNRSLLDEQWKKAKLLSVNPQQWHRMAAKFEELSARQTNGIRLGLFREPLRIYGNHLSCCWTSDRNEEIALRFDVLAAAAGQCLGAAPGIRDAIRETDAHSWADFWKYCLWFHLGQAESIITEPLLHSVRLCLHIAFRFGKAKLHAAKTKDSLRIELSPRNSEVLDAISDISTSLERIPAGDPLYEVWKDLVLRNQTVELDSVINLTRRAQQGKGPEPREAMRLALALFDNAAVALIGAVEDAESAAACEDQLRRIVRGCLVFIEMAVEQAGQEDAIPRWRRKLELKLVDRFATAKKRILSSVGKSKAFTEKQESLGDPSRRRNRVSTKASNKSAPTKQRIVTSGTREDRMRERRMLRDAYKREGKLKNVQITDEMIARAANLRWHDRTPVQKWLAGRDPRYNSAEIDRRIRSVFRDKPHLKPDGARQ